MGYVLKNGSKYLGLDQRGSYTITDKSRAMIWRHEDSAKNVIKSLPKSLLQHNLKAEIYIDDTIHQIKQPIMTQKKVKVTTQREINSTSYKNIQSFIDLVLTTEEKKNELSAELSKYDAEINDILHAAEFYTLNAAQGYKIYKQLHNVRIKRRQVKDEIAMINLLSSAVDKTKVQNLQASIKSIEKKSYTPRINEELFANGTEHI